MIAVPRVSNVKNETGKPSQRSFHFDNENKYAAQSVNAPVMENSYILPQGTRCAESPRVATAIVTIKNPRIIIAVPTRPARSVLEKSNAVDLDPSTFLTDHATSNA